MKNKNCLQTIQLKKEDEYHYKISIDVDMKSYIEQEERIKIITDKQEYEIYDLEMDFFSYASDKYDIDEMEYRYDISSIIYGLYEMYRRTAMIKALRKRGIICDDVTFINRTPDDIICDGVWYRVYFSSKQYEIDKDKFKEAAEEVLNDSVTRCEQVSEDCFFVEIY